MNITFACPKCGQANRSEIDTRTRELACAACKSVLTTVPGAVTEKGLETCAACPSGELFVRKDFSQRLGVTIVVLGALASTVAWAWRWPLAAFAALFVTALIDLALYFIMGNVLECYHCKAQYRGLTGLDAYEPFRLEIHEKYRQQAARLAEKKERAPEPASEGAKV